jgi:glycerophosphoryl diester phosphodiesterase
MEDQLTGTSNAGAVTHATGTKVFAESFGLNEDNSPVVSLSGKTGKTILDEAIEAGKATALIQSGHIGEPGSAAFAAKTTNRDGNNIRARDKTAEIAEQVIRSGTNVILGGGEVYLLPKGTTGFHVTPEIDAEFDDPADRPTTNLIDLAKSLGYTVVYTEDQLNQVVNSGTPPEKLFGVFAANHTFDDRSEEALGLNSPNPQPLYVPTAPTVAEMLDASLKLLRRDPDGFFVVTEEEGTDNFGNNNNAAGTIEGVRRADAAIGVAQNYVNTQDPNTLVITAADSDAGGLQNFQFTPFTRPTGNAITTPELEPTESAAPFINVNQTTTNTTRNILDGSNGSTGSPEAPWRPFPAQDSLDGDVGDFAVGWVGTPDFPGSIVSKTYGLNAEQLPSTLDNTEIYRLMYQTLFGTRFSSVFDGAGGQKTVQVTQGEGVLAAVNFGGVGRGVSPAANSIAEADTIRFSGQDLTARNMLLTQEGNDTFISFEGVENSGAILRNFQVDQLDNLQRSTGASVDFSNIIFEGGSSVSNSFDVFDANSVANAISKPNSVTFLNDLDNVVSGLDNSDDVINAQAGNDIISGLSGNDYLRGGVGDDTLIGGLGEDILAGGLGADRFVVAPQTGTDLIRDFKVEDGDRIALSGGLTFGQLSILQGTGAFANSALIQAGTTNELLAIVAGVQANSLTSSAFTLLA